MRKRISICVCFAIVISMFALAPVVSTAAEPVKVYDFYFEDQFKANGVKAENECVVEWKDNALHFTAVTADSKLGDTYFYVGPGEAFETKDNPWMVIKLKNLSDVETFEMHYGTSLHTIKGDCVAHFPITAKDSEYKTYIINVPQANLDTAYALNGPGGIAEQAGSTNVPISELTESTWEGTLTDLRFDCLYEGGASGLVPDGAQMQIEYAAFFASEADAKAYAQTGPNRETHTAPPTVAPATGEESKPNADVLIMFKEDGDWEDYIDVSTGPFNNMTFDDFNEAGDGIVYTIAKGGDPNATMSLIETVDAEEWPVVQMKIKKQAGTPGSGSVYYTTSMSPDLGEAQTANFKYTSATDWQIININMNEKNNGKCTGDYKMIRLDPFGDSPSENTFEIAYIAFFKSMAAAEGYQGDFSEILAAKPTPAPKTTAPASGTPKATSTAAAKTASTTPKGNTSSEDSGLTTTQIVIIAVAAVVVIAVVVAIILISKKKKAGTPKDSAVTEQTLPTDSENQEESQEAEPKDSDDQGDQKE